MKDSTLFRISLIVVLFGIIMLYFLSRSLPLPEKVISDITGEHTGTTVRIRGTVLSVREGGTQVTLSVGQETPVSVVVFKKNSEEIGFVPGESVSVMGQVAEYQGHLQIVADEIRSASS